MGLGADLRAVRHRRLRFRNLLQSATLSGSPALVSDLNPTRAEVIAKDADGNTCLHHAASTLSLDLVKYLLSICVSSFSINFKISM